MSDLGSQIQTEIDAIKALRTASETPDGQLGDDWDTQYEAFAEGVQRALDAAASQSGFDSHAANAAAHHTKTVDTQLDPGHTNPTYDADEDGVIDADVSNTNTTSDVTTTGELSVTHNGSATYTFDVVYHYEDTDTTTPFLMDTGTVPEHDEFIVEGMIGGHDTSAGYKPVQIQCNNDTTRYRYRYRNGTTLGEVTEETAWKDELYSTRPFNARWKIAGRAMGVDAVDQGIRSQSTGSYLRQGLIEGTRSGGSFPLESIQVFTDFNATGKLVVRGVDF